MKQFLMRQFVIFFFLPAFFIAIPKQFISTHFQRPKAVNLGPRSFHEWQMENRRKFFSSFFLFLFFKTLLNNFNLLSTLKCFICLIFNILYLLILNKIRVGLLIILHSLNMQQNESILLSKALIGDKFIRTDENRKQKT